MVLDSSVHTTSPVYDIKLIKVSIINFLTLTLIEINVIDTLPLQAVVYFVGFARSAYSRVCQLAFVYGFVRDFNGNQLNLSNFTTVKIK